MRRHLIIALVLATLFASAPVYAGQFWKSDDSAYWWYWDDAPRIELLVPADLKVYAQHKIFGESLLDINLSDNGPVLRVACVSKMRGGWTALKQMSTARWQHILSDIKIASEKDYTSEQGIPFKFIEATGTLPSGKVGMIRLAAFFKDQDVAYVELFCESKEYTGNVKNHWMKAIHTLKWR